MDLLYQHKSLFLKPCYGYLGKYVYRLELTNEEKKKIYKDLLQARYAFDSN